MKIKHRRLNKKSKVIIRQKFLDKLLDNHDEIDLDMDDLDMNQMVDFIDSDDTLEFAVWIEVKDTELNTDILSNLSFSTYMDENEKSVQRKWKDLKTTTHSADSTRSLRFLTGITDKINKNDLVILRNSSMRIFNSRERQDLLKDEGDIYWIES